MKTIKRFSFESEIFYNGKVYYWNPVTSAQGKPNLQTDVLTVEVYNRKLKGKTDLHGQPYTPSKFFYSLTKIV
jgi:hypothetical protein